MAVYIAFAGGVDYRIRVRGGTPCIGALGGAYQIHGISECGSCRKHGQNRHGALDRFHYSISSFEIARFVLKEIGDGLDRVAIPKGLGERVLGQCHVGRPFVVSQSGLEKLPKTRRSWLGSHISPGEETEGEQFCVRKRQGRMYGPKRDTGAGARE
jgi:hypothetical protein